MEKNTLNFDDLDLISRVTGGRGLLENGLFAPCVLNEWMDFDLTRTAILLKQGQEMIRFW